MGKPKSKGVGAGVNRERMLNGKVVQNCLYNGIASGHGKYFAAMVDGQLIVDENGRPLPFREVGVLV
jgi:hypothetical protein